MPSERVQRQIDRLLDDAEVAVNASAWPAVAEEARAVLAIDEANEDAVAFLKMAEANGVSGGPALQEPSPPPVAPAPSLPASFASGRYAVRRFLGEGGRKRVYLAHDSRLDREVAFCVIRAEGLDPTGRQRVLREAQSVARLGQHPNLVTVHDIGEDNGNPYIVQEYMGGGDVSGLIGQAEEHRLPVERTLAIAKDVCRGLSFIHAGGMVHRDLKPANVFLSTDGAARIGDFGLAVALDRSRITQYGLMLGTVSYMPPEQALGGESTLKADLYSLGAMLYEMVTGRPPFLGDDPTAVISQHINTPPVAPSWVTEHCPPSLEEVILKLLEKDPGQRPANAAEVLSALEKVDPSQKSASHSDSNVLDRLARGVFVGRDKELDRLRKAFDEAFAGRGGLVMLVGEPGIGKTRTTQELETYARMRGAQVIWGRTHESTGAPPYWPWIQAGNQWAAGAGVAPGALNLSPATVGELSRIFPDLRQQPGFVEPRAEADPESAQFRLFDAFATFIRAVAADVPLVIALDDLHWADKPTLLLLQHVARELSRTRILIIGNYRDTDITRQSALSESLAVLNREGSFERVVLRGLSRGEVDSYIEAKAHVRPTREVLDRIYEETEGNPFFLSELINLMAEEGTLSKDSVSDIAVPEGVREALGRRLNRLSGETNELLQVATIIGREFSYDALVALGDWSEDQLLKLIEEALDARVIEELDRPGRYRFTHAQMQETLLAELSTTRRVRMHGRVGAALEVQLGDRAVEQAPRLARHFLEAATLNREHAAKALRYSWAAGEQCERRAAWEEAVRHYQACLELTDSEPTLDVDAGDLLLRLAICQVAALHYRPAWETGKRAMRLYQARGVPEGVARALLAASFPAAMFESERELRSLRDQALTALGESDLLLRAELLLMWVGSGDAGELAEAESLALANDFPDVQGTVHEFRAFSAYKSLALGEARAHFAAAHDAYVRANRPLQAGPQLRFIGFALLHEGRLDESREANLRALTFARGVGDRITEHIALVYLADVALLRGDIEAVLSFAESCPRGFHWMPLLLATRLELRGELEAALRLVAEEMEVSGYAGSGGAHLNAVRARLQWRSGDLDESRKSLSAWQAGIKFSDSPMLLEISLAEVDECLSALGDDELVQAAYDTLVQWPIMRVGRTSARGFDHIRGHLALRLDLVDEAEQHFRIGLDWCERERCPIEAGRCLQGLAEVARRRGSAASAFELLDRAAVLFQRWGAKRYLDEIVARKVELQGITSEDMHSSIVALNRTIQSEQPNLSLHAAPDGSITLMFTDIENSTALTEQLGDTKWIDLLREHNAVVEGAVQAHGGRVVKNRGDGYMLIFARPERGLDCAAAIQKALAGHEVIRVRIGLHTGNPVREGEDFFGTDVNFAARVADRAHGGQVLVSARLYDLLKGEHVTRFGEPLEVEFKGFSGTHRVYAVVGD